MGTIGVFPMVDYVLPARLDARLAMLVAHVRAVWLAIICLRIIVSTVQLIVMPVQMGRLAHRVQWEFWFLICVFSAQM